MSKPAKQIFWTCFQDDARDLMHASLLELHEKLPGVSRESIQFAELPHDIICDLDLMLAAGQLDRAAFAIRKASGAASSPFAVTVLTTPDDPLSHAARGLLPHALWGISLRGALSVTYHPTKFAIWHETLHLLGIADHYDLRTFRTACDLPSCIMQYAPSAHSVGHNTFLCEQTLKALRASATPSDEQIAAPPSRPLRSAL